MSRVLKTGENQITVEYGNGHNGVDLVKKEHSLDHIITHSDGQVVWIQTGYKNNKRIKSGNATYGNVVKIKHDNGYYTLYAHLKEVNVKLNQRVEKGQVIGCMGDSGYAFGAHLHFEVRNEKNVRIDPTPYLDADLPNMKKKITCEYRAWDNVKKQWLPKVKDREDYAGNIGNSIGGFQLITNGGGITKIRAHILGGSWLEEVTDGAFGSRDNDYAGIKGRSIDAVVIWSQYGDATYRVHTKKSGWLPWVNGSNINDFINGYAGNFGEEIDAIECYIK